MLSIANYPAFIAAILVFQLIPGAGTVAILSTTASRGRKSGFGTVAGIIVGDFFYMSLAVAGLAAILMKSPQIIEVLHWIGILYMAWIGVGFFVEPVPGGEGRSAKSSSFLNGFFITLANPKSIFFFLTFFPLFVSSHASPVTLVIMMAHVTVLSLVYQCGLVLVGHEMANRLRSIKNAGAIGRKLAGGAILLCVAKLAFF